MATFFGEEARSVLLRGMKYAYDAVLQGNDLRNLTAPQAELQGGIFLMQEAARKMQELCGEGVKLAVTLSYRLATEPHDPLPHLPSIASPFRLLLAKEVGPVTGDALATLRANPRFHHLPNVDRTALSIALDSVETWKTTETLFVEED